MRNFIMMLALLVPFVSTGCNLTPAQEAKVQVIESDLHTGIVDVEDEVQNLGTTSGQATVDSVEAVIAPYAAKSAALAAANQTFLTLWTNFKAGTVGPKGSPVTVSDLSAALAVLDSLTGQTTTAAAKRQATLKRVASLRRPDSGGGK